MSNCPAFASSSVVVSAFTPSRVWSSTTSLRPLMPRAASRVSHVRRVVMINPDQDTKFTEPQAGDPDYEQPPLVSEEGKEIKAQGDGTAAKSKADNDPAWMDTDSFKPADPEDSEKYDTSVKVPELEDEAKSN